jgi:hypothetical protein
MQKATHSICVSFYSFIDVRKQRNKTSMARFNRIQLLREVTDLSPIRRVDLKTDGAFLLYNVLSPKECEYYIAQTEALGYSSLEGEYNPRYRKNDRVICVSLELAKLLFDRVKPFIPATVQFGEHDFDAHGCNEVFRFVILVLAHACMLVD